MLPRSLISTAVTVNESGGSSTHEENPRPPVAAEDICRSALRFLAVLRSTQLQMLTSSCADTVVFRAAQPALDPADIGPYFRVLNEYLRDNAKNIDAKLVDATSRRFFGAALNYRILEEMGSSGSFRSSSIGSFAVTSEDTMSSSETNGPDSATLFFRRDIRFERDSGDDDTTACADGGVALHLNAIRTPRLPHPSSTRRSSSSSGAPTSVVTSFQTEGSGESSEAQPVQAPSFLPMIRTSAQATVQPSREPTAELAFQPRPPGKPTTAAPSKESRAHPTGTRERPK
jgi:hypothetical protein